MNRIFLLPSHGKGPCDGVGGTIKRLATKASLHRTLQNHILTPLQLFEYCSQNIHNIKTIYLYINDWENENNLLKERHQNSKTIPGTRKLHSFIPINEHELEVRSFSSCDEFTIEKVIKKIPKATLTFNIGNYVTVVYRNYWWLALVKKLIKITKK